LEKIRLKYYLNPSSVGSNRYNNCVCISRSWTNVL